MRVASERLKQAAARWWEKHICAEDPDDRRERLLLEAAAEIAARTPHVIALHAALEACALRNWHTPGAAVEPFPVPSPWNAPSAAHS